jgi:hypothetical protein
MDTKSLPIRPFKAQLSKFSGIISKPYPKTVKRFFREMLFGIQASKDVKLSNIVRSLQEDIPLIKTEDRLSRNLSSEDFSDHINSEIIRLAHDKITDAMVIAIDPGDIMKPYAKAMENLCGTWDGSEGEKARGYHLCQVTAANLEHNKIVPVYCEAYSSKEKDYVSSTQKVKSVISKVIEKTGTHGIWAIDRMGDCDDIINHFTNNKLRFVTRLKLDRWLTTTNQNGGKITVQSERLERHMNLSHKAQITKIEDGKETIINILFGIKKVAMPASPDHWFYAVVVKGFGEHPMILITNLEVDISVSKAIYYVVEVYLTRWKCDECFRYIKQSYNVEDVRVRSYTGIRNTIALVHAIAYFTSVYMGMSLKLKLCVQKIFILSKRFFGVPTFFQYAMADGIAELLNKARTGIESVKFKGKTGSSADDFQLSLFPL